MNVAMLLMIRLCVAVKHQSDIIKNKDKVFSGMSCLSLLNFRIIIYHKFD